VGQGGKKAGLTVKEVGDAVKGADLVMMLLPDENIAEGLPRGRRAEHQEGRGARPSPTASTSTSARSSRAPTSTSS
jgi:hypothetical protein